jgi:Protein of unknown function (DUF3987)
MLAGPWPQPETLGGDIPPVPSFKVEFLPEALRPWVTDTAERMQVPLDVPAACAVVALGGCVNRRAVIQPKTADSSWKVVPNLWGGIVLPPGFLKSPTLNVITHPVVRIEDFWRIEYESAVAAFNLEREQSEIERAAWRESCKAAFKKGQDMPIRPDREVRPPVQRRLVITDSTFEKVHEIMRDNPAGLFMIRDELTGWLAELEREGRQGERAFFLSGWNGDSGFTIDRIGRGNVHVPHCALSILGGIQPARLRTYLIDALRDGPANDGLMQRFQVLVWPDVSKDWKLIDRAPHAEAEARAVKVFKWLAALDPDQPRLFRFAADAQQLFYDWLCELEGRVRGDELHPALISHLAKYRSLMPSLALLFELADQAAGPDNSDRVSLDHARQAAALCEYLEAHAVRIYSCVVSPELRAARELAKKIKGKKLGAIFSLRDIYVKNWSGLDTPEAARMAVRILEDSNWVRALESEPGRGRPSERFAINPRVWQ